MRWEREIQGVTRKEELNKYWGRIFGQVVVKTPKEQIIYFLQARIGRHGMRSVNLMRLHGYIGKKRLKRSHLFIITGWVWHYRI